MFDLFAVSTMPEIFISMCLQYIDSILQIT